MLPIPRRGIHEVLSAWSGPGKLFDALAAVRGDRDWSATDVRRRAHRVAFQLLRPTLVSWPRGMDAWLEALPAVSFHHRTESAAPTSGTSWRETLRRGWPPGRFHGRRRIRSEDVSLVAALRWTLDVVLELADDAIAVEGSIAESVGAQLDVARRLLDSDLLEAVEPAIPSRSENEMLRGEGYPWNAIASTNDVLRRVRDVGAEELARTIIEPDDELRPRLFHLAVFGEVLVELRSMGFTLVSLRPLSGAARGGVPAYRVTGGDGSQWELWFEAGGAWSHYGVRSPYVEFSAGTSRADRSLGPDVMLVRTDRTRALVLECKYSAAPEYFARVGYEQTSTYCLEIRSRLVPGVVEAAVVAPDGAIRRASFTETMAGKVGLIDPSHLVELLRGMLAPAAPDRPT